MQAQLTAWSELYDQLRKENNFKTQLVPLPGNHEVMRIVTEGDDPEEVPNPATGPVWLEWLKKHGYDSLVGNGPTGAPPNPDLLKTNNRHMTYSFRDDAGNHFILMNTDTLNNQSNPPAGWIPYHWIARDIMEAEADPKVKHVFALGHKPIRIAGLPYNPPGNLFIYNSQEYPLAQSLQKAFTQSSKFRGYLCAHLHLWDCELLPDTNDTWQVIAGNGGSKIIETSGGQWQEPFFFGFTEIQVKANGTVDAISHERPIPKPYNSTDPQPAEKPQTPIPLVRRNRTPQK